MVEQRRIGDNGVTTTPVVLGTWALGGWLWGGTAKNRAEEAILTSLDEGITAIDTAPAYGFGLSEELVGHAIRGRRDEIMLATKCGLVWDDRPGGEPFFDTQDAEGNRLMVKRNLTKASILRECDESLKRLGVDVIDLYQCHWPDQSTPLSETVEALEELKAAGKIREYGVSNFSVEQLAETHRLGSPVTDQPKYSLVSREIESDVLPWCRQHGVGILAYSPMEMGLLTGKIGMDTQFSENDTRNNRPWFAPEQRRQVLDALEQLEPIAGDCGATLAQLSVAWIFSQPGVTAALVGARDGDQARSNAHAASLALSDEVLGQVRALFEPLRLPESYDPAKVKR